MKRKYTDEQFAEAVKSNFSIRETLKVLGLAPAGGSYKLFHARVKRLNLDTSHFTGQAYLKGKNHNWGAKLPLNEILILHSLYTNSNSLRKRLIKEGFLNNECAECTLHIWKGKELSLHLDHINGNNTDNRLENLRLLCPNCHSLTPTYCGRNKGKYGRSGGT